MAHTWLNLRPRLEWKRYSARIIINLLKSTPVKHLIDRPGQLAICKGYDDLFANCLSSIPVQKQREEKLKNT